jgi:type II secretory pathway pseudopilin PulG
MVDMPAVEKLKGHIQNRNGFTFLMAIFMVMIVGILSAYTGKSWTMIMKREREKELLLRGSQIKEAIENWYDPKYNVHGVKWIGAPRPLMDLKDLVLDNPYVPGLRYLPQSYAAELDSKNPKCSPDCPKLKIDQDPMTGKAWTILRSKAGSVTGPATGTGTATNVFPAGGIIGVASKSDETPVKTDFKNTALENMASVGVGTTMDAAGTVPAVTTSSIPIGTETSPASSGGKMTKYSEWKFIADKNNDHKKIYRAYHESW